MNFFRFANFSKKFLKNFYRIGLQLILILKIILANYIGANDLTGEMTDINRFVTLRIRGIYRNKFVNKDIKNLLITSNLVNSKILNLSKSTKSNFAKVIYSKIDFLTFETKKLLLKR